MKRFSIICCLLAMAIIGCQLHAQSGEKPKYVADVPESITPPRDTVETERHASPTTVADADAKIPGPPAEGPAREAKGSESDAPTLVAGGKKPQEYLVATTGSTSDAGTNAKKNTNLGEINDTLNRPGPDLASLNLKFTLQEDLLAATEPASPAGTNAKKGPSLEEISNKLNNPGADLASLNFKLTWNQYKGDLPGSSSQNSLMLNFQPVLPFKLADGGNFLVRPSIPLVWQPNFNLREGSFDEQFGLGDSQLVAFYSRTEAKKGYMWGLGAAMQAPTHTDDALGKDQFQLGPAGFAGIMGKWGSAGVFPQHLWNIGGSSDGYTATTTIQPWYWFSMGRGWQMGGSPSITYDWAADHSNEAWTVPVNFGVAKTIMVGETPVKLKFEAIYYITQPDTFGPRWGLQLTITPVVQNVFADLFK